MNLSFQDKHIFILGIGSDIGTRLAEMFLKQGAKVSGTYRTENSVATLRSQPVIKLFQCDATKAEDIMRLKTDFTKLNQPWDVFISAVGILDPIGKFFALDFKQWEDSVRVNSTSQLHALHALHPFKRENAINHVIFFAGGGTNTPFRNYSAYCLGKILLIKMCELLDDEDPSLNAVILGTGWVNTKIHRQTLQSEAAGDNRARTAEFIKAPSKGTSYQEIFNCIAWCIGAGRELVGGRNFSIVHDQWRDGGKALLAQLQQNPNQYKLRRHGNG